MRTEKAKYYPQPFIGFSILASEYKIDPRTLKNMILRNKNLVKELKRTGWAIKKNKLPARTLSPTHANLIRAAFSEISKLTPTGE